MPQGMFTRFHRLILSLLLLLIFVYAGKSAIDWIQETERSKPVDTISVGMIDDTPPFCFYNDNNELVGINIDIVREIARRIGKKPHIESVSFNRLTSGLMTKQYDMVSIGSITPHREKVVRYVQPHIISADVLVVHSGHKELQSLSQFRDQPWKIGVYNGTSYIQLLKDKGLEKNMAIYPNQRDVFLAFYKNRVDAMIMNEHVAGYIQQHLDPGMVILPEKVRTDRRYAFAVRKEDLALWKEINDAVTSMLADGTLEVIFARWMSPKSGIDKNKGNP